jgi:hypothetical protein
MINPATQAKMITRLPLRGLPDALADLLGSVAGGVMLVWGSAS